jgi:hypothetical protein
MNHIIDLFNKNKKDKYIMKQTLDEYLRKLPEEQRKMAQKQLGNMIVKERIKPIASPPGYMLVEQKIAK